jgi:hypothetical protein
MADPQGWRERRVLKLKSERLRILDARELDSDHLARVAGGKALGRNSSRYCITTW